MYLPLCISSSSPGLGFKELEVKLKTVSRPGLQATEKRPGEVGRRQEEEAGLKLDSNRKEVPTGILTMLITRCK